MNKKLAWVLLFVFSIMISISGCGNQESKGNEEEALQKVTVILDWIPNTNHTGMYVANDLGYYAEAGLKVDIKYIAEGGSADLVAAEKSQFGISYQEEVTYARTADKPLPIQAIATIIQHNTSGFASPVEKGIKTPKDFENKKYGGWGYPMEEAMLKGLMEKSGADFSKLSMLNIGTTDFFTAIEKDIDFAWIYYGWDGVAAGVKKVELNFMKLQDIDPALDYYTPVIIAHEKLIKEDPELVRKFLSATAKGYEYAVHHAEEAVESLLKFAPDIDKNIAVESQKYLANEYISDAKQWGAMKSEVWKKYSDWMYDKGLLNKDLDENEAFTNEFLPK